MALSEEQKEKITKLLSQHDRVLFMKGNRTQPRCGFSATVVQILDGLGADYQTVDVLADAGIRDGIKEFGNWPTIPQLYYKGTLIGGCDIVREMDESGELAESLGLAGQAAVGPPKLNISDKAAEAIREAAKEADPGQGVRIIVRAGGKSHDLSFDHPQAQDLKVEEKGVQFLFDRGSARLADGLSIDFVMTPDGGGFRIDNPNAPPAVKQLTAQELKEKLDAGEQLRVYDVRTQQERGIASIDKSILLDDAARAALEALPKDSMLVFHCHHGGRSQQAAEHFLQKGFRNVWNLQGGIDAWSLSVNPKVKRY